MQMTRNFVIATAIFCSTGCVNLNEPISSKFGEAYRTNLEAQIVDPTPAKGAPKMSAQKADAAIDRYHKDEIKEPVESKGVEFGGSGGD